MFQSVFGFIRDFFTNFTSNPRKRQRRDDSLELYNEEPPKKFRMNSESGSDLDFSDSYLKRTRETYSQTNDVIDLDEPAITTISLLDDNSSVSDKENVIRTTEVIDLDPSTNTVSLLDDNSSVSDKENVIRTRTLPSSKSSPKNKSFQAPLHCRSPHKIKFKHVSHRRKSNDIEYVGTFFKDSSKNEETSTLNDSKLHLLRRMGSSSKKPFVFSRTEQIMSNALKHPDSFRSSLLYDIQSRKKYGELLGKVLKSPEMFSSSYRKPSNTISSKIIDLTRDETVSTKSQSDISFKTPPKSLSAVVDLTSPTKKSDKSSEIINLDDVDSMSTLGALAPHRRIVSPINTFSRKLKHIPCTNNDYITDLDAEIENLKRDFAKNKEQMSKVLSAMSPLRHTFEKALEKRLRRHLKITSVDLDLEEEDEEEAEILKPQLSNHMINIVMNAWDVRKPKGQVLVNNFNYQIKRADLLTLSGLNWLNDEVINYYMELISLRGKEKDFPSVHTFNTFFYLKLEKDGHAGLRRWTRKVDIFSYDLIVIPIHLSVHWCLAVINFKKKSITYYDSMGQANDSCVKALLQYLVDEHLDKKKESFDTSKWELSCTKDTVPQQMNSCDCGVFACTFAEYSSREAKFQFSQEDMPYFRRKMTYEILSSQLLPWN